MKWEGNWKPSLFQRWGYSIHHLTSLYYMCEKVPVRILPSDTRISGSGRSEMHWLTLSLPASISVVSIPDPSDPFLVSHSIIILKHPMSSPSIIIINHILRHGQGRRMHHYHYYYVP